jgi:hypothetical protein
MEILTLLYLPNLSPIYPKITEPIGRAINPTLKVKKVSIRALKLVKLEKKAWEIFIAKIPYNEKSYHSIMLPKEVLKKVDDLKCDCIKSPKF